MKSKETTAKYSHSDPIESLNIMKNTVHTHSILDIGKSPFYVKFHLNEQITIYKLVKKADGRLVLCMDATSVKTEPIRRSYEIFPPKIFLYILWYLLNEIYSFQLLNYRTKRCKDEAERIIVAIFIVANCPTTECLDDKTRTKCSKQISFLRNLITDIITILIRSIHFQPFYLFTDPRP